MSWRGGRARASVAVMAGRCLFFRGVSPRRCDAGRGSAGELAVLIHAQIGAGGACLQDAMDDG